MALLPGKTGVKVQKVAGPSLEVGDEIVSVDGRQISAAGWAHANHLLAKPGAHRLVLLRERTAEEKRRDACLGRALKYAAALLLVLQMDIPALIYGVLVRRGFISLALPGGEERDWDPHLMILSIGSTSRRELQQLQAATIGCSAHLLRYDESVARCADCSQLPSHRYSWLWGGSDFGYYDAEGAHDQYFSEYYQSIRSEGPHSLLGKLARPFVHEYLYAKACLRAAKGWLWAKARDAWELLQSARRRVEALLQGTYDESEEEARRDHRGKDFNMPATLRENATKGWWCAQQRLLAALADALRSSALVPEFLLVVDDDTFVNTRALRRYLHARDPEVKLYAGDFAAAAAGRLPFLYGGGGHLLSRRLLRGLKAGINLCLRRSSVEWCEWHSDWVLPACMSLLGIFEPSNITDSSLFVQDCAVRAARLKIKPSGASTSGVATNASSGRASSQQPRPTRCDRKKAHYYRTRSNASAAHSAALGPSSASLGQSRQCRDRRNRNLTRLVTCHGLSAAQMGALARIAC